MSGRNSNSDIWLAGAAAAFTVDLLVYPLDTLKTRLQSPDYKRLYINASTNTVKKAALFRGLYQGVGSVIIATLPSSGAFFTTYEGIKHVLANYNPSGMLPQPLIHSAASATAELVSCAILTPAEVIKQNAQMLQAPPSSSSDSSTAQRTRVSATLRTLRRFRNNPSGLWRGYTALASRNLPFTALQFPLLERFKSWGRRYRERRGLWNGSTLESGLVTAASASLAGGIAALVTTPIDVVKTRIMLAAADGTADDRSGGHKSVTKVSKAGERRLADAVGNIASGAGGKARKSGFQIGREILADQGVRGLWRGGALRSLWTMLGSGLYLGVYESGRIYLGQRRGVAIKEEDLF